MPSRATIAVEINLKKMYVQLDFTFKQTSSTK